ncbi:MAG: apolipoprotein N-acyltransferase [Symploca sp. SIO1C4]|uniref:Apolipoprotein N-acyltransferase n=1 Tax=Symploca sp. SIO1C4 TaxID=2607765 RepID=A0A6B3NCY7_9CYAN|nr:apolipoprotein N-acyltransferase [Symploca sp. SIO1C4]
MNTPKQHWQIPILALSGGILMGLTPSPTEAWPLAWIALVPLWFLIASGKSIYQSAWYGLIWGIGYHSLALFWITGIHPMDWMGVPWLASIIIALFCWIFITLWGAVLVAFWSALIVFIQQRILTKNKVKEIEKNRLFYVSLLRVLIGVALWCGLESVWSNGSLWWTSLSYTQSPHNLVILHLGQLSGPFTITAVIVAVNGLIAEALVSYQQSREKSNIRAGGTLLVRVSLQIHSWIFSQSFVYLSMAAGLFIILHLIGFGLYSRPLMETTETALKVGIIQGNIPNEIKLYSAGWRRAIEGYTNGYKTLAAEGVEAVMTPETALPFVWDEQVSNRSSFYNAILDQGVLVWVGAFGKQGSSFTNSLFTVTGTGETVSQYDKFKLVPLGEYIPFEKFLGRLINRLSPLDAHLLAGDPNQIFKTPFGKAIVGICYESAFSQNFRRQAAAGGEFILTASNNAHYSETMPAQHHAQDVLRAIETDRWAVRATNTGYSGIVEPHGKTLWISGINTYEIHAATVYRRQTQTLYVLWGDWLTPTLLGLGVISWFVFKRL